MGRNELRSRYFGISTYKGNTCKVESEAKAPVGTRLLQIILFKHRQSGGISFDGGELQKQLDPSAAGLVIHQST